MKALREGGQQALENGITIASTVALDGAGKLVAKGLSAVGRGVARELTMSEQKAIRSLEKRIVEHIEKVRAFKANPTVRPGMENLPKEVIKAQQEARIKHLETEIKTFRDNIRKILEGDGK